MATLATRNHDREAPAPRPVTPAVPPASALSRRNRLLGVVLASVAAAMLAAVVAVAVLLHYAEAHHALSNF
jgi:hypothetical protein